MTGTSIHRVVIRAAGDVDRAAAAIPDMRFERHASGVFLELPSATCDAVAVLARAGIELAPADRPARPVPLRPAVVPHLVPFGRDDVVDTLVIRHASLAEATAHLARRSRWALTRRTRSAGERLRAVLRGDEHLYRWRRLVYAPAEVLRARTLRGVRPVVFDRRATGEDPSLMGFASDGALATWLRG